MLPAERDIRVLQPQSARLDERTLQKHDASHSSYAPRGTHRGTCSTSCRRQRYGSGSIAMRAARGPVTLLSARITPDGHPVVVAFAKGTASAFERLDAGSARLEGTGAAAARPRAARDARHRRRTRAPRCSKRWSRRRWPRRRRCPSMKSKSATRSATGSFTLLNGGSPLDCLANASRSIAAIIWRAGSPRCRRTSSTPTAIGARYANSRAREGWASTSSTRRRCGGWGAGAFLAVSRANEHRDAGIVRLRYRAPQRRKRARLALVGKGICFDTGGINLKTAQEHVSHAEDMQGSAVAVGTLLALSELKAPYDIDCWLAITENEIGARAYRPQEVVRAANGVTIQVAHSDAEGRMVLADTLALAAREQPELIIDFATLTGACVNALTERYSGAFTNRAEWHDAIDAAGRHSGERVWPFPMDEDYDSDLESSIADVLQCTPDSKGDHILAARFLNRFVPAQIPWIHIDLAASNRSGGLGHVPTDFTGFGVRYAMQLLLDQ